MRIARIIAIPLLGAIFILDACGSPVAKIVPTPANVATTPVIQVPVAITQVPSTPTQAPYTIIDINEVKGENVVKNFTVVAPQSTGALPTMVTDPASDITDNGATLHGSFAGLETYNKINVYFEYGPSTGYEISTNMVQQEFTAHGNFATAIAGLKPDTRYLFRTKGYVWDASGQFVDAIMVFGEMRGFTTAHDDIFQYHQ